jgi:hypothetical protein
MRRWCVAPNLSGGLDRGNRRVLNAYEAQRWLPSDARTRKPATKSWPTGTRVARGYREDANGPPGG